MNYQMNVIIEDPNTEKGMYSGIPFRLYCEFSNNPFNYGKDRYVLITCNDIYTKFIDLRKDKTYNGHNQKEWLQQWAHDFWSGVNGNWKIKSLYIIPLGDCYGN